jgi:hypothetical protein
MQVCVLGGWYSGVLYYLYRVDTLRCGYEGFFSISLTSLSAPVVLIRRCKALCVRSCMCLRRQGWSCHVMSCHVLSWHGEPCGGGGGGDVYYPVYIHYTALSTLYVATLSV